MLRRPRRPHGHDIIVVNLWQEFRERSRQRARITGRYRNCPKMIASFTADDEYTVTASDAGQLSQKQQFLFALFARLVLLLRHCSPQPRGSRKGTSKFIPAQVEFVGAAQ